MPSRDAERTDRLTQAIGPELFASYVESVAAIGNGAEGHDPAPVLAAIAKQAAKSGIAPEEMLIAMRTISRSLFDRATVQADRVTAVWEQHVRTMMAAYFEPASSQDSIG